MSILQELTISLMMKGLFASDLTFSKAKLMCSNWSLAMKQLQDEMYNNSFNKVQLIGMKTQKFVNYIMLF